MPVVALLLLLTLLCSCKENRPDLPEEPPAVVEVAEVAKTETDYPDGPIADHIALHGVLIMDNEYNDADSFFALHDGTRYHFRLTGADAPETDQRYPDRVADQARDFGLADNAATVALGQEATRWFNDNVVGKEVTVWTRWRQTGGRREIPRYYSFIKVGDRWLSELLAERGFVRCHGIEEERPDGLSPDEQRERLVGLGAAP